MNLIITGYSGFIGANFIENAPDFNICKVDLLTQKVSEINFDKIDSVLHLAALVHQMKGGLEEEYFKINRDLAFDVAKRAKEFGVKQFVLMSTAKVFGETTTDLPPWNENSDCNPLDSYGKSKYEAEKLIMNLEDEFFKVAIVRSPLVYGSGVKANMYNLVRLVDSFSILPLGGIKNKRSFVYVGNLVALLRHIIVKNASGIFIAGDEHSLSTTELIELIGKSFDKRIFLIKIPKFLVVLFSKIKPAVMDRLFGSLQLDNVSTNNFLNFTPPYTSDEGIKKMVEWYKGERLINKKI